MSNPKINKFGNKYWYNKAGEFHREDGPAKEFVNGTKFWYQNNKLHRTDGPAVQCANGSIEYYLNHKKHRVDGPAVIYADGHKEYWINGKCYDSLEEGLMDQALG